MTAPELQQHLYELEERLLHPDRAEDRAALISLLAEDYQEFCSNGKVANYELAVEYILNHKPRAATIHHYVVTPLSDVSALATYRLTTAVAVTYRSSIWVFRNDRWQLFFHQGTEAV